MLCEASGSGVFEKTGSRKKGIHFSFPGMDGDVPSFLPTIEGSRVGTNLGRVTHTSMRTFSADVLLGLVLAVLPGESVTGLGGEMEWGVRRGQQRGEVYPVRLALAYINLYQPSVPAHQAATHVELHVHLQCSRRTCSSSSRACHMSSAAIVMGGACGPSGCGSVCAVR